GLTNRSRDLGGKPLELLKEAVPKVARISLIYDPTPPGTIREVKEDLPVTARALGLTIQSWAVRTADDFDAIFAAMDKQRPDALYVTGGPILTNNGKRIADVALKGRLPSTYYFREGVDAGGLM